MRIANTGIQRLSQCAKPNCDARFTVRHHRGGEFRYLRIMAHQSKSKEYKAFAARYYEFHPDDVVEICHDHHEEIHVLYWERITDSHRMIRLGGWPRVRALVTRARKLCDKWLLTETPGTKDRSFTNP